MASRNGHVWTVLVILLLAFIDPCLGRGNRDIMHDDAESPEQHGCENSFVLVKVRIWMDDIEATELVGVSAWFRESVATTAVKINALPLAVPSPANSCNMSVLPIALSQPRQEWLKQRALRPS